MTWHVDFTTPGYTPPTPLRCTRCEWVEVRSLGSKTPELVLARPCEEHAR